MTTAHECAVALRLDISTLWTKAPNYVRPMLEADVLKILHRLDELIDLTSEDFDHAEG